MKLNIAYAYNELETNRLLKINVIGIKNKIK